MEYASLLDGAFQRDVREGYTLERISVVRADAKADVDAAIHRDGDGGRVGGAGLLCARVDGEAVATAHDAEAGNVVLAQGDVLGFAPRGKAVLEGDVPVGVDGDVGVGRAWLQAGPEHEHAFGDAIADGRVDVEVGSEGSIAGDTGPDEAEGVGGTPDIIAPAHDLVGWYGGVVGGDATLG